MTHAHAPAAEPRPVTVTLHGDTRTDEWGWLRDKEDPEVIALLEAENAFTAAAMVETQGAQQRLYEEIVSRIQETDLSVPVQRGEWQYYSRTEEGKQYPIHCRRQGEDGPEHVLLDQNIEAGDASFFAVGIFDVSPDGNLLAYGTDHQGDEKFTLRIRDLRTGLDLPDLIERTSYGSAWSRDGAYLFFTRPDAIDRPFQVWRHRLGSPSSDAELIYQDDDERFFVGIGNTLTDDYVLIHSGSSLTSEVHLIPADHPTAAPMVVEPRREGVEYHVVHHRTQDGEDQLYVLTNEGAPNFALLRTPVATPGRQHWTEVVPHREDVKLDDVDAFARHLVLSERCDAIARVTVLDLETGTMTTVEQPEAVYTAHPVGNAQFDTDVVRFEYTSLVTPRSVFDLDLRTGERRLRKQQPVLGDFEPTDYVTERLWATSHDGARVPISVVRRIDRPLDGGPALLYGYGAYEICIDPTFSTLRLSLLDRGFVFAIAHVRGGGEMGRAWYEGGKFANKANSFKDFIACAEHLVDLGYTAPENLAIRGGSAGGLLVGTVTNLRPDLFAAVVAEVPFVDCLNTMLDPSLPLTVHEYEEWGNPQEPGPYADIRDYSPYDNVREAAYPTMLVTAGLNDPRVGFWEPAKWVQRLRRCTTSTNPVLLKTEMGAGHMGPSGRYDAWRDEAFVYAFIFMALGIRLRFH